jgi:hypothetical protein
MVMGRSYKQGRTIGRMGMSSDVRPSNRAEVGLALPGIIGIIILFFIVIGVFL